MSFEATDEQREIIRHPLVPLRVAAGAGTGKTATLAQRIVHLVSEQDVEPEQVLGITFTNKAAGELGERIRSALGEQVERGREVEVVTYHAFAHRILQEFGALVGVERDAKVITPPFARQLMRNVLGQRSWATLDLTYPGGLIDKLAGLSSDLGDNLLTPLDLVDGAPDPRTCDEVWQQRLELVEVLNRYQEEKSRLGVVDYADLVRLAHHLLQSHPELAERLRDRYRAVLLDEYQDTNPAQRELLRLVFGAGFSVTAVGDPAQTIYEWRGASLENFDGFPDHFPTSSGEAAETLPLLVSRRSDRLILDLANRVQEEIGGPGELAARKGCGPGRVATRWLRTAEQEARWIAGEIARLQQEGLQWREMAVLFRKTKNMELVRDALENEEIPLEVASLGGLLAVPEVVELRAWLRVLEDPEDAPALARILLGSSFRLGLGDLVPLVNWVRARGPARDTSDDDGLLPAHSLLEGLDHLEGLGGLSEETRVRLEEFRRLYRELLQEAQGVSLVELCRRILDRLGAWAEVEAMLEPARLSARLNLHRFLDLAEEWSPLEGTPSLAAFLEYLQLLEDEAADEGDAARLSGEDAVSLLTVHRAKGLEWSAVFVPALYEGNFPSSVLTYEDPCTAAQVLPFELRVDAERLPVLDPDDGSQRKLVLGQRHESQEWRTAYVAVTRAAHSLYLTGAYWYSGKSPQSPSPLYIMGRELPGAEDLGHQEDPGERPGVLRLELDNTGAPDPHFPEGWDEALRRSADDPEWPLRRAAELGLGEAYRGEQEAFQQMLLELPGLPDAAAPPKPLRASVTGLVTYATCPRRFYWSEVDRLPRRFSAAARRGVELHRRIELHLRGAIPFEEAEEDNYDLSPGERSPGAAPLHDPFSAFQQSRFAGQQPLFIEAPFDLKVGRGRVRGRVDAIYPAPHGGWEVVDFKSGRPTGDLPAKVQLESYALAAREAGFAPRPPDRLTVTFAYFRDGPQEASEEVDRPWLESARRHLEELVGAIEQERYEATPSQACGTCDFLKFCRPGREWMEATG